MRVLTHFALWLVGAAKAETQTSEAERRTLGEWARGRRRLAEIGVWHGVTTTRLRREMDDAGVLYAVDPFPVGRFRFSAQSVIAHREVAAVKRARVRWVRLPSAAAAPVVLAEGALDFVFIDGDHSYEGLRTDWEAWSPGVARGGVVALHDSVSSAERSIEEAGSVRFTREFIRSDPRFEHRATTDTLTIWQRR